MMRQGATATTQGREEERMIGHRWLIRASAALIAVLALTVPAVQAQHGPGTDYCAAAIILDQPCDPSVSGTQISPSLGKAWNRLVSHDAWFYDVVADTEVTIAPGNLPARTVGQYNRRYHHITINRALLGEDPRALAAVLAHEIMHVEQVDSGYEAPRDCVQMEKEAFTVQAQIWEGLWGGYGPSRTPLEQHLNAVLRTYLTQGDPGMYRVVTNSPGDQQQCNLWVP